MNVLLDTAAWINAVKEPETMPVKVLSVLRDGGNSFFLSDISLLVWPQRESRLGNDVWTVA